MSNCNGDEESRERESEGHSGNLTYRNYLGKSFYLGLLKISTGAMFSPDHVQPNTWKSSENIQSKQTEP